MFGPNSAPVSGKWNRLCSGVFVLLLFYYLLRTSQWKWNRLCSGVFFVAVVLLSPSCTLVRTCGSCWIVWIKCEILIVNVGNNLRWSVVTIIIVKLFKSGVKRFKYSFPNQKTRSQVTRQTISIYWIPTVCPVLWKHMIIILKWCREKISHIISVKFTWTFFQTPNTIFICCLCHPGLHYKWY